MVVEKRFGLCKSVGVKKASRAQEVWVVVRAARVFFFFFFRVEMGGGLGRICWKSVGHGGEGKIFGEGGRL